MWQEEETYVLSEIKTIDELYELKFKVRNDKDSLMFSEKEIDDEIQKRVLAIKNNLIDAVTAETYIYVEAACPKCNHTNVVTSIVEKFLTNGVSVEKCEVKTVCTNCLKPFIIGKVNF